MATGPTYTPIAEDAGKKVSVAIHNKGVVNEWEVGCSACESGSGE